MGDDVDLPFQLQRVIRIADNGETAQHAFGMLVDQNCVRIDDDFFIGGKVLLLYLSGITDITVYHIHFFPQEIFQHDYHLSAAVRRR